MNESEHIDALDNDIADDESLTKELSFLFGADIVEQARLIDIADLNLTDEMTSEIAAGVRQLKKLIDDPVAQQKWVQEQAPGLQVLLCLWVMDMDLLDKIKMH